MLLNCYQIFIPNLILRLYKVIILIILGILSTAVFGQERGLLWQETFGGSGEDQVNALVSDKNDNYYVVGTVQSEGDNVNNDVIVSKFDVNGTEIWSKSIQGEKDDRGVDIILTSDNKLLVLFSSNSRYGDFVLNNGYTDVFLAQLSLDGKIEWMNNYGGSFIDLPTSLYERSNGEVLISAHTRSYDGDVSNSLGQFDFWLLNVDKNGALIWEKSFGGSEEDFSSKVIELSTGEIVLLGESSSYDNDILLNYGDFDVVVMKLGATGKLIWSQNFGGEKDDLSADILEVENQSLLIVGNTFSTSIDIENNAGFSDAWAFQVSSFGDLEWSTTMGSTENEISRSLSMNENGEVIVAGTTNSASINNSNTEGHTDIWLATINSNQLGSVFLFGSAGFEEINSVLLKETGEVLIGGSTSSDLGFINTQSNTSDGWLVKLAASPEMGAEGIISVHPNPSNGVFYLNYLEPPSSMTVFGPDGKKITNVITSNGTMHILDLSNYPTGIYYLNVEESGNQETLLLSKR